MKILIVSVKPISNTKIPLLSSSEDYFEKSIKSLGHIILAYDYIGRLHIVGKERMNIELLELVIKEQPDFTLFEPYQNEFIPKIIDEMNNHTITVAYYFDDTWRIDYSYFWSKHYQFVTTSAVNGKNLWKYRGCNNFIYSPFACNHEVFKIREEPKIYDVSFVGGYHPYRAWCIRKLRKAGIKVNVWGVGWKSGALNQEDMVKVFNQSKINLNLSNNESFDLRFIFCLSRPFTETLRVAKKTIKTFFNQDAKTFEMVKARHFEINSCGGFQLSYYVEGLEQHYRIGDEIALYQSVDEMIDKVKYFLDNEHEREVIAKNGHERTLKDHRLTQRFTNLFNDIKVHKNIK